MGTLGEKVNSLKVYINHNKLLTTKKLFKVITKRTLLLCSSGNLIPLQNYFSL